MEVSNLSENNPLIEDLEKSCLQMFEKAVETLNTSKKIEFF